MLDLKGPDVDAEEREWLAHPAVGGVILFRRNYQHRDQLRALVQELRRLRPGLLVAADQEGGRVQRFAEGFTRLPPMGCLGRLYARDPVEGRYLARELGWLLARELRDCGLDFSFAPVLDLDRGISSVIGDRALAAHPEAVIELGGCLIEGMGQAGMAAVGKHFPGHGAVVADSHHHLPRDERAFETIAAADLQPFARLAPRLGGIMPAHLVYTACDPEPAGFSSFWLQRVLRQQMGFQGAVFSDDLSMAGAAQAGNHGQRARAALRAGCDQVLVCNSPAGVAEVLQDWNPENIPRGAGRRLVALRGQPGRGDDDSQRRGLVRALIERLREREG